MAIIRTAFRITSQSQSKKIAKRRMVTLTALARKCVRWADVHNAELQLYIWQTKWQIRHISIAKSPRKRKPNVLRILLQQRKNSTKQKTKPYLSATHGHVAILAKDRTVHIIQTRQTRWFRVIASRAHDQGRIGQYELKRFDIPTAISSIKQREELKIATWCAKNTRTITWNRFTLAV